MKKITENFDKKAVLLFLSVARGSNEYNRFAIILAYSKIAKLEWMCVDPEKNEECITMCKHIMQHLQPFEDDLMGIYPLAFAFYTLVTIADDPSDYYDYSHKMKRLETKLVTDPKYTQVWDGPKLFKISSRAQSTDFIEYQKIHNINALMIAFKEMAKEMILSSRKEIKNRQEPIHTMIDIALNKLKSNDLMDNLEAIGILRNMYLSSISNLQFKQAQHFLAIAMYNLVKIRRSFPMTERSKLNEHQAILSNEYTNYAIFLVAASLEKVNTGHNELLSANPDYVEMTDFVEPGLEIYSSQYPTDYVEDPLLLKKILKKALAWNKRSIEMAGSNEELTKQYTAQTERINSWIYSVEAEIKMKSKKA